MLIRTLISKGRLGKSSQSSKPKTQIDGDVSARETSESRAYRSRSGGPAQVGCASTEELIESIQLNCGASLDCRSCDER